MDEKSEKRISWTKFKSSIVSRVGKLGGVYVLTYRDRPQLTVTSFVKPSQAVSLRHVAWQQARTFDLWTWRGIVPCIITMGKRKTPVAVVEQWTDNVHETIDTIDLETFNAHDVWHWENYATHWVRVCGASGSSLWEFKRGSDFLFEAASIGGVPVPRDDLQRLGWEEFRRLRVSDIEALLVKGLLILTVMDADVFLVRSSQPEIIDDGSERWVKAMD